MTAVTWEEKPSNLTVSKLFRSTTGEGNFNWRFVFPFEYEVAENNLVYTQKDSVFSWDKTTRKIKPILQPELGKQTEG